MEIIVKEKPENLSYEKICKLIREAHKCNIEKGLKYGSASITEEGYKKKALNISFKTFVAMVDDEVVGTLSVSVIDVNRWFHKGKAGYIELVAVDPEIRGKHIFKSLYDECERYLKEYFIDKILIISAEKNEAIKSFCLKNGFYIVKYGRGVSNNFFSNFYFKWINGCPHKDIVIKIIFLIDKMAHIIAYKIRKREV